MQKQSQKPSTSIEPGCVSEMDLCVLAKQISEIPGILSASAWTRVKTKERIYVELKKRNRQRCWDLGAGRRIIVHGSGRMEWLGDWAGAMTRDWHAENRTWHKVKETVKKAMENV
jgi:hypothetical protein